MSIEKIKLFQTTRLKTFRPILEGFIEDFGYSYYHAILSWCGFVDISDDENEKDYFWEVWLIKQRKKIIGISGLYSLNPDDTSQLWLGWLGVLKEYRNKSIGTFILKELENKAKKVDCKELLVYVDKNGAPLNFYYRNGFEHVCKVGEYVKQNNLSIDHFEHEEDFILTKKL